MAGVLNAIRAREEVHGEEIVYRIYSINRPERLLNFWTLRVGAY